MKSKPTTVTILISAIWAASVGSAQGDTTAETDHKTLYGDAFVICQEPRPEVCMDIYAPVCAAVDSGIRCVTAPCPTMTQKTEANACYACSNPSVIGYRPGTCEEDGNKNNAPQ